jgi:hypothetical protein
MTVHCGICNVVRAINYGVPVCFADISFVNFRILLLHLYVPNRTTDKLSQSTASYRVVILSRSQKHYR